MTNLVKLIRIDDKRSKTVERKFAQCWLTTRYPWPQHCVHDPGTEFTGLDFQMLLQNCHIRDVCTTAINPQSNAVCERILQTIGNILRTKYMGTYCQTYGNTLPIQYICTTLWGQIANTKYMYSIYGDRLIIQKKIYGLSLITMHGMRAGVHSTSGSSPGNLLFNRDMFLNIHLIADWHAIIQRREHLIHEKLMRENQKRRGYN